MADLNDLMSKLSNSNNDKAGTKPKLGNLVSKEKPKGKHGGLRPNGGRPKKEATLVKEGVKAFLQKHGNEEVNISMLDKKTGKTITIKKTRIMFAMEKLYEMGTTGAGNPSAIDLWLNRLWGRAAQPVRGEGEDDSPIKLEVSNLSDILRKAYGSDTD